MKPFFSSRISKLGGLITFCALSVTTFSTSAMADPIRDLQNEVAKRGKSPEDVNQAMRARFPESDFPYFEPVNGCSNWVPGYGMKFWNEVFKDACNKHDRCYATPGRSQSICDDQLLTEMLRICKGRSEFNCPSEARVIYGVVYAVGHLAYDKAQTEQSEYIKSVDDWLNPSNATVFQTNSYISTEISVKPGDRIKIKASGTVRFGAFAGSGGPNGIAFNRSYNYFRGVPHGCLMARVRQPGMGKWDGWSPIGAGWDQVREVKLLAPGVLEFLVNDNDPHNNSGAFRIEITIYSAKK